MLVPSLLTLFLCSIQYTYPYFTQQETQPRKPPLFFFSFFPSLYLPTRSSSPTQTPTPGTPSTNWRGAKTSSSLRLCLAFRPSLARRPTPTFGSMEPIPMLRICAVPLAYRVINIRISSTVPENLIIEKCVEKKRERGGGKQTLATLSSPVIVHVTKIVT